MKTVKFFLAIVLLTAFGVTTSAQTTSKSTTQPKTETFKVWGKCDMCKTRIEKTVKAEGATSANWDSKTELLTVTLVVSRLLLTVLKAFKISADTFSANKAVNTRYIMLIIFCRGSRGKDMTICGF